MTSLRKIRAKRVGTWNLITSLPKQYELIPFIFPIFFLTLFLHDNKMITKIYIHRSAK